MKPLAIGGHRRSSSRIIVAAGNDEFCEGRAAHEGYGAFSVSVSQMRREQVPTLTIKKSITATKTFEEEFIELLTRHGIEYDSCHVF